MAEFCSCGAQLPPDALFCHKCGKPQRDLVTPEIEPNTYPTAPPPIPQAAPPSPPAQLPMNFHNGIAVRIAMLAAVSATVLAVLLPFMNWLAAGFFAVYFYCRKTGFRLNVASGVKIGWITGLIAYCFYAIVFAARYVPEAMSGTLGKALMDQMKNSPLQDPTTVEQTAKIVQAYPAMVMVLLLGVLFVLVTCLTMAGGALGAKLVGSPK